MANRTRGGKYRRPLDNSAAYIKRAAGAAAQEAVDALPPSGSAIDIKDEGVSLTTTPASINFTGTGVTATTVGDDVEVNINASVGGYTAEDARDDIGAALVEGAGIDITVNDGSDTITIASTITQYTDEMARDALGTALVAGSGITITPNDGSDTITIAASGGGGGNAWLPAFTTPVDGNFTWVNQGSASTTVNANGGIYLLAPAATENLRIRIKSAPVSTPYSITIAMLTGGDWRNVWRAGICVRQSSDGKVLTWAVTAGGTGFGNYLLQSLDYTALTTGAGNVNASMAPGLSPIWLRYTDNGTNRILSYSADGYNFIDIFSETRTTFLTADQVGFFITPTSASSVASMTLLSYLET